MSPSSSVRQSSRPPRLRPHSGTTPVNAAPPNGTVSLARSRSTSASPRATSSKPYKPIESRDVTAEIAAVQGRKGFVNGRRPTPATQHAREKLPRPGGMPNIWGDDEGSSQELAELVQDQRAREQAHIDEQTREAQQRYQAYMDERRRAGLPAPSPVNDGV